MVVLDLLLERVPHNEFWGLPIQDQGNDCKAPKACFDFGALKTLERFSTIPFKSIHRDLRTVGAQGAVGIPNFYFSGGLNVRWGGRGGHTY